MSKLIHQNTLAWVIAGIWRDFPKGLDMPKKNTFISAIGQTKLSILNMASLREQGAKEVAETSKTFSFDFESIE